MKKIFLALIFTAFFCEGYSQLTTRVIRDSLFIPWELVYAPDDHIWFTQKNGYVCRLDPVSTKIDTLYHETATQVNNEGGMLGMALHPSFPAQPYVYVAYEYNSGSYKERIVRYTYSGNVLQSPQTLIDDITGASIHNGCRLLIVGDKLFISTGDAGNQSNPQNINVKNGKILRINLDGSIPVDNPIPGNPVWSWGHRNAQGLIFANNKIYSSEHGPSNDDELNIILKGRNYGWPTVQGFCNTSTEISFCNDSNVVEPLIAWTPTIAVSDIEYYDHPMFPAFANSILLTTLKEQQLLRLQLNAGFDSVTGSSVISQVNFGRLRAICVSPLGKIYIATSNSSASGSGTFQDQIVEIYDPSFNVVTEISKATDIALFPNPAGEYTIIRLSGDLRETEMKYAISDAAGKLVKKGSLTGNNTRLDTRDLARGTYMISLVTDDGKRYSGRIVRD